MMLNEVLVERGGRSCRRLGPLRRPLRSLAQTMLDFSRGLVHWHLGVGFEHIREGLKVFHRSLGAGFRTEPLYVVQNGTQLCYRHGAATPSLKHLAEYHFRCLP